MSALSRQWVIKTTWIDSIVCPKIRKNSCPHTTLVNYKNFQKNQTYLFITWLSTIFHLNWTHLTIQAHPSTPQILISQDVTGHRPRGTIDVPPWVLWDHLERCRAAPPTRNSKRPTKNLIGSRVITEVSRTNYVNQYMIIICYVRTENKS